MTASDKKLCTLISSFQLPDEYKATGIAAAGSDKAWVSVFHLPMVLLVDSTGQILQTGFASDKLRKIKSKNGIPDTLQEASRQSIWCKGLTVDNHSNCIVVVQERYDYSIKQISPSGAVSTITAGLQMPIEGVAFSPNSKGKGKILFGYMTVGFGLCSIDWPRGFLSRLFLSRAPVPFASEWLYPLTHGIAADTHSDLICVSDLCNKLCILNKDGQTVAEYTPEDKDTFFSEHVCFDHTGSIIVLNLVTSSVLRISPDGHLLQTILQEVKEDAQLCEECKKLKLGTSPQCRECKNSERILAISVKEDIMWVSRVSGKIELYRLL